MNIGPIVLLRKSELPFYKEVHRAIRERPDYLDGIRKGLVHIKYRPGCAPKKEEGKNE